MKKLKKNSAILLVLLALASALAVSAAISSTQSGISLDSPASLPSDI